MLSAAADFLVLFTVWALPLVIAPAAWSVLALYLVRKIRGGRKRPMVGAAFHLVGFFAMVTSYAVTLWFCWGVFRWAGAHHLSLYGLSGLFLLVSLPPFLFWFYRCARAGT
jgi:hypothetical protein